MKTASNHQREAILSDFRSPASRCRCIMRSTMNRIPNKKGDVCQTDIIIKTNKTTKNSQS